MTPDTADVPRAREAIPTAPRLASPREPLVRRGPVAPTPEPEGARLTVGRNIRLKGEIANCDTLFVEGYVEAAMDSRRIVIADDGVFIGAAAVDVAEVRGRFEGDLTVRERLVIHSGGQVAGKVRYGEIVIEPRGQIRGDIGLISGDDAKPSAPTA